jgi:hypothetical protein
MKNLFVGNMDLLSLDTHPYHVEAESSVVANFMRGGPSSRPQQCYLGGPRSVHLTGLRLSFYFGRIARTGCPIQARRCLSRVVGTVPN